jgi:predicted cupin superfamily sugar epimerase
MDERAAELIRTLALEAHREGGYFGEIFRSPFEVEPADDREERSALTTIYFLLLPESPSCWHRLRSDEVWHFFEGSPVEHLTMDPDSFEVTPRILGPLGEADSEPARVVPARYWQAARTTGSYSLVGCTIGPGFEYEDFELLRDNPEAVERFNETLPKAEELI